MIKPSTKYKSRALLLILVAALFIGLVVLIKPLRLWVSAPFRTEIAAKIPPLGLEKLSIELSTADLAHFKYLFEGYKNEGLDAAWVKHYQAHNEWRGAQLRYNGKKYEVKVKSHGRSPWAHYIDGRFSLSVKLKNGEQIFNSRRINLIIYQRLKSTYDMATFLPEKMNLIHQGGKLIEVSINGASTQLYYLEKRITDKWLETVDLSSYRSIANKFHTSTINSGANIDFIQLEKNILNELETKDYSIEGKQTIYEQYMRLNEIIRLQDHESIVELFDESYITRFMAVRSIYGDDSHGFTSGNLTLVYNLSNGKFYPVYHRDCLSMPLDPSKPLDEQVNVNYRPGRMMTADLFALLTKNNRLRQGTYREIHKFLMQYSPEEIDHLSDSIKSFHSSLIYSQWLKAKLVDPTDDVIKNNMHAWDNYLSSAAPIMGKPRLEKGKVTLIIEPNSMAALSISKLIIPGIRYKGNIQVTHTFSDGNNQEQQEVSTYVNLMDNPDLSPILSGFDICDVTKDSSIQMRTVHLLEIIFSDTNGNELSKPIHPELSLINNITGESVVLEVNETLTPFDKEFKRQDSLDYTNNMFKTFGWQVTNDQTQIPAGTYVISQDLKFPHNSRIIMDAGVQLLLDSGISITGSGTLEVNGTASNPVRINSTDPTNKFGTFGFQGLDKHSCSITHLEISNGNEAWIDGAHYSGMLSLYHYKEIVMANSRVSLSSSDDGLNIKYCDKLTIDSCVFENNFADQVDLDHCIGSVTNTVFQHFSGSDDGDGLDLSGCYLNVHNCQFQGLGDKGLSIGENSRCVIENCEFSGNNLAIAAKDMSQTYLADNTFLENNIDLSGYRKKKIWSGSQIYIVESVPHTWYSQSFDKYSKLTFVNELPEKASPTSKQDILRFFEALSQGDTPTSTP